MIQTLRDEETELRPDKTTLLITAASGLQIGEYHDISLPEHELDDETPNGIRQGYGPHVGSFKNKIFKRYLYDTGIPSMLFIDSSKVDCKIKPEHCHFLFDPEKPWKAIVETNPLGICVGCPTKEVKSLLGRFEKALPNFDIKTSSRTKGHSAFIATNKLFATNSQNV